VTADVAALPVEVQRIVADLSTGPSMLLRVDQADITAAFDHGIIQAICGGSDGRTAGHTMYSLRRTVTR
jgi:hypothetical protein